MGGRKRRQRRAAWAVGATGRRIKGRRERGPPSANIRSHSITVKIMKGWGCMLIYNQSLGVTNWYAKLMYKKETDCSFPYCVHVVKRI
jgi:hypothetical protein